MSSLKKLINVHLFLKILCMMNIQIIHAADEPTTRIRRNSSLETIVEGFAAIQAPTTQSPLHIPSNTTQARPVVRLQPLGCCALLYQGTAQLKKEWNDSYPHFKKCTWPPRVDRSNIHPDIVECNTNSMICVAYTVCCPCTTSYFVCANFLDALNDND